MNGELTGFSFSLNEEDYYGKYATREEAQLAALEQYIAEEDPTPGDTVTVWTGENRAFSVEQTIRTWDLIDHMRDEAYEFVHDHATDWLEGVTPEQERLLQDQIARVVKEWMTEHNHEPRFWCVENVTPIVLSVPEHDLATQHDLW